MFLLKSKNLASLLVRMALLTAISISAAAQAQRDEPQAQPTTGAISGRVVNENGQPLANASVFIRGSVPLFPQRTTTTDSDGNFQVAGLDPVLYGISAVAPAYVTPSRDPDSPANYYRVGDSVTLNLVKGGVITGSVQHANGEPVVQIAVRALMVRDANGQTPRYIGFQTQKSTDDRGIYRLYGLVPGTYVVSTGGRAAFTYSFDPYDTDAPTYAPSSPRDTAVEVTVRAGEETNGIDIRYRGEPGRRVSGTVIGALEPSTSSSNVTLVQIVNGLPVSSTFSFQQPGAKGYVFYGIADGDYDLVAQSSASLGEISLSEPRRISVRGSDIAGLDLVIRPLSSINGRVILEKSDAAECRNKRQPLFSEMLIVARRNDKDEPKDQPRLLSFLSSQGSPTKTGEFQLRNIAPGKYNLGARFFARYWYLRSITRDEPTVVATTATKAAPPKRTDLARAGLALKFSERQRNVTFTLTEGAASLRGMIKLASGEVVPPKLYVHLVPAEKEHADDVLRFFSDEVAADGSFALNNLPPGRYLTVAKVAGANESFLETKVRAPRESALRTQIRRAAEAAKTEVEFKPCQNVTSYSLPLH
jgi:hypothetical protein